MRLLEPRSSAMYIDATIGRAGHARRILEMSAPDGQLLGVDADREAIDSARVSLAPFAGRVVLATAYFDQLAEIAKANHVSQVNGILFDLGISSPQVENSDRGFSFQSTGPLDMRMDQKSEVTAGDLIASASEDELIAIFRDYGEERHARRIARRIVAERTRRSILTTTDLARLVAASVPGPHQSIHPATRVFQALRIAINDELRRLRDALPQALDLLAEGGRLVVISFHSLEDRIVKQFMQSEHRGCICSSRDTPVCVCGRKPRLKILTRKPIRPQPDEVRTNPRSRSAKLRAAEAI